MKLLKISPGVPKSVLRTQYTYLDKYYCIKPIALFQVSSSLVGTYVLGPHSLENPREEDMCEIVDVLEMNMGDPLKDFFLFDSYQTALLYLQENADRALVQESN